MSFLRPLAQVGTFGLAGLAASSGKKKTTPTPPATPSLMTVGISNPSSDGTAPSLVSKPQLY